MNKLWLPKSILLLPLLFSMQNAFAQQGDPILADIGLEIERGKVVGKVSGTHDVGLNVDEFDFGSGAVSAATATGKLNAIRSAPESVTRGAKEAKLYAELSPRVVMVVTNDGLGSGAIIENAATILTNWHVVEGYETVGVIYKPVQEGRQLAAADVRKATVVRIDQVSDLALLKVEKPPQHRAMIELGDLLEVPVGSDVHAIGHPTGESWTYTRGIVSQMRRDYEWVTESGKVHRADVIQTQTPINPGNSGGPLISDSYKLVGINSFKAEGEALNFAVSVDDVKRFLSAESNRYADNAQESASAAAGSSECEPQRLGAERSEDELSTVTYLDLDCDGGADGWVMTPDDSSEPEVLAVDSSGDGKVDTIYADLNRDGEIDESYHDVDADGITDVVGYHQNGDLDPYRWETYEG